MEKLKEMTHEYSEEAIITYLALDRTEMENIELSYD